MTNTLGYNCLRVGKGVFIDVAFKKIRKCLSDSVFFSIIFFVVFLECGFLPSKNCLCNEDERYKK